MIIKFRILLIITIFNGRLKAENEMVPENEPDIKLNGKWIQRKDLIKQYSKYIGLVGRCRRYSTESDREGDGTVQCEATEIGVFVYHNLLLTSFAWDLVTLNKLEETNRNSKTIGLYIAAAKEYIDEWGKEATNYTKVHYVQDWRTIIKRITGILIGSYEGLIPIMPIEHLSIVIGEKALHMNGITMDYMRIPSRSRFYSSSHTYKLPIIDKCFMLTYGGHNLKPFHPLTVRQVLVTDSKICREPAISLQLSDPLCIRIEEKVHGKKPHGGEPIICDDELLCILSKGDRISYSRKLYPCTSVLEHRSWIQKHIRRYGFQTLKNEYTKYVGLLVNCYKRCMIRRIFCLPESIGVIIYDNLILTNTMNYRKFVQYNSSTVIEVKFLYSFMGGARDPLNISTTTKTNRKETLKLFNITSWQRPSTTLSNNTLYNTNDLVIAFDKKALRVNRASLDPITLPTQSYPNTTDADCFMMTYGPQLEAPTSEPLKEPFLQPVEVHFIEMNCNIESSKELCIGIVPNITNIMPHGGEPVICNDTLYAILTNKTCQMNASEETTNMTYYICTSVYNNMAWINEIIGKYGIEWKSELNSQMNFLNFSREMFIIFINIILLNFYI